MLLSKKYIFGHLAVILIVIGCVLLSNWQFSRLSDRKDLNSKIQSRMEMKEVELTTLVDVNANPKDVSKNEYRRVSISGKYEAAGEVLISGRFIDGEPGYNVVTPLVLSNSGDLVFVNRGWIKLTLGDAILAGQASKEQIKPAGGYSANREVVGLIRKNEAKQLLNKTKKVETKNAVSNRISTEIFGDLLKSNTKPIFPLWVQLEYQRIDNKKIVENKGPEKTYPIALAKPELTEKNHLSYAIQWLLFAVVAFVTWTIICRKALKAVRKK